MNLSEVLNVALPELPARRVGKERRRLHPKLIAREQIEDGVPVIVTLVSGSEYMLRFSRAQWELVQLFDGKRSYRDVAELYAQQTGVEYREEQVREFAAALDEGGVWQKEPTQLDTTAGQKLADQRQRRVKKRNVDLAQMTIASWDPDAFLTRLHELVAFIYTRWLTLLTLGMFAIMTLIFIGGWHEIWRDTVEYYTFTHKGAADLGEFWIIFFVLAFFHESAHGLSCKHFGGEVHRMGFLLIYLSPAFFCDISEVYVYGGRWPRIIAIISGIWVELMFCSVASIIWWGTPLGSPIHDFAYKIMLITGVAVVLMNLNPLIKLDGYYLFSELIDFQGIKEFSTAFLSSWVKRNLLGMPVEVPYLRPRRRWLFAVYAVLSGLYSYLVLFVVVRLTYNICYRFSPQWAFFPALAVGLLILRARLRSSVRYMKDYYLDKRQSLRVWWTAPRKIILAGLIVVLFAPVWRETVRGRFVLEPEQRAVIRATVPGQVTEVLTDEGSPVTAGTPIFRLRNVKLEEQADRSLADLSLAQADARQAELNYADLGRARGEQSSQTERYRSVSQQVAALQVLSPISGVVVTPRIRNLAGSFVAEGTELAEVDDIQTLKARIFIPDFELRKVALGAPASLKLESEFQPIVGRVALVSATRLDVAAGLLPAEQYKGIVLPPFYVVTVPVPNPHGSHRVGMSGDAKIEVRRRSSVWFVWENVREFIQRKIW
jgi:putative peptide zinc metalloprotease protein